MKNNIEQTIDQIIKYCRSRGVKQGAKVVKEILGKGAIKGDAYKMILKAVKNPDMEYTITVKDDK